MQTFKHHVAMYVVSNPSPSGSITNVTSYHCSFDVRHMPQGCSTWPSIWEAGLENWPADGEIDIIEGANDRTPNEITLHATSGCNVPQTREQTGNTLGTDCNTPEPDSVGCGVGDTNDNSYGPAFNDNGGGWYALERTDSFIKVWFWPRNVKPPSDVVACGSQVNTDTWVSQFSRRSCVQNQIFTPSVGYPNCVLPQHAVQHRQVRGEQHHHQLDSLW